MGNLFDMNGNQLRKLVKAKGMTGAELAKLRGIRPETVSRHMNDRTAMSQADYQAYAEILEVEVTNLMAQATPTPIFGVMDRSSMVHERHSSMPEIGITFGGPSATGSVAIAVLQPKQMIRTATHDFSRLNLDEIQMDGCFLVHKASLTSQEISHHCHSRLCLSSALISEKENFQWVLGALYPEPEAGVAIGNAVNHIRYTIVPYNSNSETGIFKSVKVEAAAPVLSKIYAASVVGAEMFEVDSQTEGV